jgi:iron complex outermembrane receptor protein
MKIINFRRIMMMGLILIISVSSNGLAQTDSEEKPEKVYRLDKIIVRDHPVKDEGLFVTPDATVINVDKFQKAGPVQNIRDLLSEALGIDVLRSSITPSPTDSIYIRGMDQSRFQVFLDGRPMRLMGRSGYIKLDWTTMPLDNVETIEVIRGSHSLLYPFSMGGAINIITKKGIKTDEIKPKMTVKTEFGSYGQKSYSANVLGGVADTIGYSIAAAHREGDGYLRNNDYDTDSFNTRLTFFLPTGGTLTGGWDHVENETGYPVINDPSRADYDSSYPDVLEHDVDNFVHGPDGLVYPGGDSYWEKRTDEYSLLLEHPIGSGELRAQVFQHESERDRYWVVSSGAQKENLDIEEKNRGAFLDLLGFELFENHSLSIGGEYRTQGMPENKDFYEIMSAYFQDVYAITPSLTLTWGTRWYEFQSDAYKAGFPGWSVFNQLTGAEQKAYETRRVETEWCPKARLSYDLDPGLTLYASVSREMRTP